MFGAAYWCEIGVTRINRQARSNIVGALNNLYQTDVIGGYETSTLGKKGFRIALECEDPKDLGKIGEEADAVLKVFTGNVPAERVKFGLRYVPPGDEAAHQ